MKISINFSRWPSSKGFWNSFRWRKKLLEHAGELAEPLIPLKILRKQPVKKSMAEEEKSRLPMKWPSGIIKLKKEIEKLYEEKRLLEAEISRVGPFGDFSMEDIDYIENFGKRKIQFFCMKTAKSHKTNFTDEVIYIGTEYDLDYFVTINPEPRSYPDMIEMRIDRPLGELKVQLEETKESLHRVESELKSFAGHIDFFNNSY